MRSKSKSKISIPAVLFFTISGLFLLGSITYIIKGSTNPDFYWSQPSSTVSSTSTLLNLKGNKILLVKDRAVVINDAKIAYKGTINGNLIFEYSILKLDPHYAYSHQISSKSAKKQFKLGNNHFRLIAGNKNKISMQLFS